MDSSDRRMDTSDPRIDSSDRRTTTNGPRTTDQWTTDDRPMDHGRPTNGPRSDPVAEGPLAGMMYRDALGRAVHRQTRPTGDQATTPRRIKNSVRQATANGVRRCHSVRRAAAIGVRRYHSVRRDSSRWCTAGVRGLYGRSVYRCPLRFSNTLVIRRSVSGWCLPAVTGSPWPMARVSPVPMPTNNPSATTSDGGLRTAP